MAGEPRQQIGVFRGNTADITKWLYDKVIDVPEKLPTKILAAASALDMRIARKWEKLREEPNRFAATDSDINSSINAIKKDTRDIYLNSYNEANIPAKVTEITKEREDLIRQTDQVIEEEHHTVDKLISDYLKKVRTGVLSEADLERADMVVLRGLVNFEVKVNSYLTAVDVHLKKSASLQDQLDTMHKTVYGNVPPEQKGGLTPPLVLEEEAQKAPRR